MMDTPAKRRKAYKQAFCPHPDNEMAIKMADLLYGDYYPKRNKEKALLDALEAAGENSRASIAWRLAHSNNPQSISMAFSWVSSKQGRAFWLFLVHQHEELGATHLV